jgi:hypothetical protein
MTTTQNRSAAKDEGAKFVGQKIDFKTGKEGNQG